MAFTWEPPATMLQNGVIISYGLSCSLDLQSNAISTSAVISDTQFTINLFVPGVIFRCQVYATNALGNGPSAELFVATESKFVYNIYSTHPSSIHIKLVH